MKVLGIIPSRFQSSRFPGKPLVDLKGKTMIQRVYEGVKKSALIDQVVVATDDDRIFQHVKSFGGKVMMTSENHTTGTDRCGEIIRQYTDYDVVVNIQGDEPLVNYKQLEQLIHLFDETSTEIGTIGIKIQSKEDLNNVNRVKIVLNHLNEALYFSRSAIPNTVKYKKNIFESQSQFRHIGLYAYRTDILKKITQLNITELEQLESLEQLRWLYYGYKIKVAITDIETPNIDTPEDVDTVLKFL